LKNERVCASGAPTDRTFTSFVMDYRLAAGWLLRIHSDCFEKRRQIPAQRQDSPIDASHQSNEDADHRRKGIGE
jgi:hypothetical protein